MRLVHYTYPNYRAFAPSSNLGGRSPWTGLETEIDRLFESTLTGLAGAGFRGSQFPVDVFEDQTNTYVRAELPGVNRDAINVGVVDGVLTLTASRKQPTGAAEEARSFSRAIDIPAEAQTDQITAAYENGVLTVTLPKREAIKPKKISVEVR